MTSRRALFRLLGVGTLCAFFSGCDPGPEIPPNLPPPPPPAKIKLGYLVRMPNEPWFEDEWKFAQERANTLQCELIRIPIPDKTSTFAALEALAKQGAKGALICAPDPKLGSEILAKATEARLSIMALDESLLDAGGKALDIPLVGVSDRETGEQIAKAALDEMQSRGWNATEVGVCMITYDALPTTKERGDGALVALLAAKFPPSRILNVATTRPDTTNALQSAATALAKRPDITHWVVLGVNDESAIGGVQALSQRGIPPASIIGIGIGGRVGLQEFAKTPATGFFATSLLSARTHGEEAVKQLHDWIRLGVAPRKETRTVGIMTTRETAAKTAKEEGLSP